MFFPEPSELRMLCDKIARSVAEDRARNRDYQKSFDDGRVNPELSPETKARMSALWSKTKNENAATDPEQAHNTPEAAKDRLEALAAENGKTVDWDRMKPVKTVDRFRKPSIDLG